MEINEAFAAQAVAVNKQMGWDTSKINVNGGAIALGHPIAATGVSMTYEIARQLRGECGARQVAGAETTAAGSHWDPAT